MSAFLPLFYVSPLCSRLPPLTALIVDPARHLLQFPLLAFAFLLLRSPTARTKHSTRFPCHQAELRTRECESHSLLPTPLFRSGRRHYCQLYCCEHLTAFRLLSFVFCVSFLCIACCIFHTLQTAKRERPNNTTRPGASATANGNGTCTTCTTACNRIKPPDLPSAACLPACLPPAPTQCPFSGDLARRPPSLCREPPQMSFRRRGRARRRRGRNKSPPGW